MSHLFRIFLIYSLLFLNISISHSQDKLIWKVKVSAETIEKLNSEDQVEVLIYLKEQKRFNTLPQGNKTEKARQVFESLQQNAAASQGHIQSFLNKNNIPFHSFFIVNAIRTKVDLQSLTTIAEFPEVRFISLDSPIKIPDQRMETANTNERDGIPEWGIQVIQADSVWNLGVRGENVVVGGQDTGYDWTHPAIKSKYRGYIDEDQVDHNYNWHDAIHDINPLHNDSIVDPSNNPCGLDVLFPCDDGSHGTHTMGTMVGRDGDNIVGVAPNAKWIGVRNMERGWGQPSTYLEAFEWFLAPTDLNGENPDPNMAPHVINNSWSCPAVEGCDASNWEFMDIAIQNLRNSGVFVVVSAGNSGNQCGRINAPPSMFDDSFAVGATRVVDTIDGVFIDDIAGYSSWGPVTVDGSNLLKPDISAPGSNVRSSVPGGGYSRSSGTSMAGPHVAGVVALIISANLSLAGNIDAIEEIIQLSADPKTKIDTCGEYFGIEIPNFVFGYGRINALKAVELAMTYTQTIESPFKDPGFYVFPNPASNKIQLRWENEQAISNVKITDLNGRDYLYGSVINDGTLNISALPDGIYIIKTVIANRIESRKFVKRSIK